MLEKECPAGESQPIEQRRMMSPDTEAWMIETMKNGPEITPEDVGMSVEDAKLLCETYSVDDMAASMESDTSDYYVMPWNGTGYMLSSTCSTRSPRSASTACAPLLLEPNRRSGGLRRPPDERLSTREHPHALHRAVLSAAR